MRSTFLHFQLIQTTEFGLLYASDIGNLNGGSMLSRTHVRSYLCSVGVIHPRSTRSFKKLSSLNDQPSVAGRLKRYSMHWGRRCDSNCWRVAGER